MKPKNAIILQGLTSAFVNNFSLVYTIKYERNSDANEGINYGGIQLR